MVARICFTVTLADVLPKVFHVKYQDQANKTPALHSRPSPTDPQALNTNWLPGRYACLPVTEAAS